MNDYIKLAVLGGDMRQHMLAKKLSESYECAIWGMPAGLEAGSAVRCNDWKDTVYGARAVILPLPASADGVTLNCPLLPEKSLRLTHLCEELQENTLLLGGKLDEALKDYAGSRGIVCCDYFACEELQIKNALPTAEGALMIAMREMPVTVYRSRAVIFGFGRIGRALARILVALGASVYVAARSISDLALAGTCGCVPLELTAPDFVSRFSGVSADVVFNTVPRVIIGREVLRAIGTETPLIDLASGAGGVDAAAAEHARTHLVRALSLPGKTAPRTAAAIVSDCVLSILAREGVAL